MTIGDIFHMRCSNCGSLLMSLTEDIFILYAAASTRRCPACWAKHILSEAYRSERGGDLHEENGGGARTAPHPGSRVG